MGALAKLLLLGAKNTSKKQIVKTEAKELLQAGVNTKEKSNPTWSGEVDILDGHVYETHTEKEAIDADYHHTFYFSDRAVSRMDKGKSIFFWKDKGKINVDWSRSSFDLSKEQKHMLKKRIKAQLDTNEGVQ